MKTEKWVQCTEELALNPHKVNAWRVNINEKEVRFIAYDKGHERPIVVRSIYGNQTVLDCHFHEIECLIEVSIQERFVTFYEGDKFSGSAWSSLENAKDKKDDSCTHILKITYDGEKFQVEPVWTKDDTKPKAPKA